MGTDPIDDIVAFIRAGLAARFARIVKPIHDEELDDGDEQRPGAFPKVMLKQTDSGIEQLYGAGERTQNQQRRHWTACRSPTNANRARGILGAAAYIAKSSDACVGADAEGTRTCGRMIAAMEKPLATRTLTAVTSEASRNAFLLSLIPLCE